MKKLCLLTENPTVEKILGEAFNNRHGDYLELLLSKAGIMSESYEVVWIKDFTGLSSGVATIMTLGRTPTGILLQLRKNFKMADVVGKRVQDIIPWYSVEHLLTRGKKLEEETIELLRTIK